MLWVARPDLRIGAAACGLIRVNQKTGQLEVDNVKVHKVPVQEDGVWTQVPRHTFDSETFDITN